MSAPACPSPQHSCEAGGAGASPAGGLPCPGSGGLLLSLDSLSRESAARQVPQQGLPAQRPHLDLLVHFIPASELMTCGAAVEPGGNESGQ